MKVINNFTKNKKKTFKNLADKLCRCYKYIQQTNKLFDIFKEFLKIK